MQLNIRKIVDCLGGAGNASKAAATRAIPLPRQTIESWYKAGTYPSWRAPDVIELQSLAEQAKRKAKKAV